MKVVRCSRAGHMPENLLLHAYMTMTQSIQSVVTILYLLDNGPPWLLRLTDD